MRNNYSLGIGPYIASLIDTALNQEEIREEDMEQPSVSQVVLDLTDDGSQEREDVIMMEPQIKTESKEKLSDVGADVRDWLEGIQYLQYLTNFLEGGFDELRLILILNDKDLNDMKIKPGHKKMLLLESQKLAASIGSALDITPSVVPSTVEAWLREINYLDYLPAFLNMTYDEVQSFKSIFKD